MFDARRIVAFLDDDADLRAANAQALEMAGFEVLAFGAAEPALRSLDHRFEGVVVTDIRMPGMDGHQLFRRLHERDRELPVILITGHADIPEAVQAVQRGVFDFIPKPYPTSRLIESVGRALASRHVALANRRLAALEPAHEPASPLAGASAAIEQLRRTIRDLAEAQVDVLIEGETGVGKEVVARALHASGPRRRQPFVAVNCAALPEGGVESELFGHEMGAFNGALRKRIGRIEAADRGTLFLDEIESLPAAAQGKLLRVLEEREIAPLGTNEIRGVDLRVLAASKLDLGEQAQRGGFRADLLYRLNTVRICVPPLRERREDIGILFGQFLLEAADRFRRERPPLTDGVRRHLVEHDWPGNVRELRNYAIQVTLGLGGPAAEAPECDGAASSLPDRVDAFEAQLVQEAVQSAHGDVRVALDLLKIPRKTFYDKLRRHGIAISAFRTPATV
jgi:two-component system C4-dicarboxylate transport response regulator DctD